MALQSHLTHGNGGESDETIPEVIEGLLTAKDPILEIFGDDVAVAGFYYSGRNEGFQEPHETG